MNTGPKLSLNDLKDIYIQKNFQNVQTYFGKNHQLEGFEFFEVTVPNAVTNLKITHNLGYQPKDLIQTSKTGAGTVTWNYTLFSSTELDLTTTGACVIRFFVGTYQENA